MKTWNGRAAAPSRLGGVDGAETVAAREVGGTGARVGVQHEFEVLDQSP